MKLSWTHFWNQNWNGKSRKRHLYCSWNTIEYIFMLANARKRNTNQIKKDSTNQSRLLCIWIDFCELRFPTNFGQQHDIYGIFKRWFYYSVALVSNCSRRPSYRPNVIASPHSNRQTNTIQPTMSSIFLFSKKLNHRNKHGQTEKSKPWRAKKKKQKKEGFTKTIRLVSGFANIYG